jgi:FtsP/CotA-like multicopper oxidase with cupredoxin domain
MGLTGIMIIDDGSDVRLDLPQTYGVDDLPIILQDRSIDSDHQPCIAGSSSLTAACAQAAHKQARMRTCQP